jgi:predicted Zn-dependent peptidase
LVNFQKTVLKNGIRVVSEARAGSRAVSMGIWILTGTRDESEDQAGISHFLEHLVFKGTRKRSSLQIAKSLEALGGELNAFTSKEYTVYHALVLRDHWSQALDVLADLVVGMDLRKSDFEIEKSVVIQEIAMGEDQHEELIFDHYFEKSLEGHPLSIPILGTLESIPKLKMSSIKDYYKKRYSGSNIIVSASGFIDHQELVKGVEKLLGGKPKSKYKAKRNKPKHKPFRAVIEKQAEQLHLIMGFPCTSFKDKNRFEAFIVNALLGGGMTSRLYQSVREKKGLVYTIQSSLTTFVDAGLIQIYAACEPKNMKDVIVGVVKELKKLKKRGITQSELDLFRTQVVGSILLGSDDVENRMHSIAINEMVFETYKPVELIIDEMNLVTVKSVNRYMREYLSLSQLGALLLGGGTKELETWFKKVKFESL